MTKTRTTAERGGIRIPKALRKRTRLDENFDEMRAILTRHGATLETAMQKLREMKQGDE